MHSFGQIIILIFNFFCSLFLGFQKNSLPTEISIVKPLRVTVE